MRQRLAGDWFQSNYHPGQTFNYRMHSGKWNSDAHARCLSSS